MPQLHFTPWWDMAKVTSILVITVFRTCSDNPYQTQINYEEHTVRTVCVQSTEIFLVIIMLVTLEKQKQQQQQQTKTPHCTFGTDSIHVYVPTPDWAMSPVTSANSWRLLIVSPENSSFRTAANTSEWAPIKVVTCPTTSLWWGPGQVMSASKNFNNGNSSCRYRSKMEGMKPRDDWVW